MTPIRSSLSSLFSTAAYAMGAYTFYVYARHSALPQTIASGAVAIGLKKLANVVEPFFAPSTPIGWKNQGNDCCFISALQLLYHTPSWIDTLKTTSALRPFLRCYRDQGDSNAININTIRKAISIPGQHNHASEQTDPMEYIRAIAERADRTITIDATRRHKITNTTHQTQEQESPVLGLSIPRQFFAPTLSSLLQLYFNSDSELLHVQKKLVTAPNDLMICVQRFQTSYTHPLWKWLANQVLSLFNYPPLSRSFSAHKISCAIDMDLNLTLDSAWVANAATPTTYQAQGFICHEGYFLNFGHYITYVNTPTGWYKCNDDTISAITETQAKRAIQYSYVVSYKKRV